MALVVAVTTLWSASGAFAAPDITLDKQAPGSVLFGDESPVTLHAANPSGQPYGYNLSFRDVLPAGVSYVPGSAPVAPRVIQNAPGAGQTTLIFENVSDLSPGSSYDLTYRVSHDTGAFAIGDRYTNQAGAFVNEDPRFVPDFAANGTPSGDFTGSASDSASTQISAIEIEKGEPSPEGELLRGAHDHQTVYTLTVRNNSIEPTTGVDVEDWLPAGLEYLGCGTDDSTTDAPTNPAASPDEYAGSGPLNPGNAPAAPDCVAPDLVETVVTDPDGAGPLPTGVYTHVVWNDLGSVSANGELRVQYVAAVPLRQNTTTWTSPFPPTPASLGQASNLDNNSGPETQDEQALTNYSTVAGDYDGTLPVSDDDTLTRTAEDLRVLKSVTPETINQGQISTWSLRINTSEYRYVDDVRVDDTLPNGLCPLGAQNFEGGGQQAADCDPTGDTPSAAYTSVDEATNGTYAIHWDDSTVPELARMQPSSELTISFPTRTRSHYQQNFQDADPVLAEDSWQNTVGIAGADFRICAPSDPDCTGAGTKIDGDEPDGTDDLDQSAASQHAGGIEIDKKVREAAPTPVDCATGTYVDGPPPTYGPGDRVCWQLRIDFAALLDTGTPELTDFLPPGVTYVPGSAAATASNNVPSTFSDAAAAGGVLTWDLGGDVPEGDLVFEWRFATVVKQGASDAAGDLEGNLMKLSYENTEGQTFPLRDDVDFERSQAQLDLVKGVRDVNDQPAAGNPPNTDGATVAAGDDVTFRVDVSNGGDLDAADAVVWDQLEDGITCAEVSAISDGGSCSGTRITWTGIDVAASATHTLTYDVDIPAGVEPGRRFDDRAGVVSYTSATNTGGSFTYVPESNIDPGAPPANAPAADDDSFVQTRGLNFAKTRTTEVNEAGNNQASQATIGERVDYTATIVVPEGTTLYGTPTFGDALGTRQTYTSPPAAAATLNGAALPGGFTLDATGNAVSLQFPASYTNPGGSGDDTFEIKFSATVADVAANRRTSPNQTLTNTADFDWQDEDATPHTLQASVDTTIVEPNVAVLKANDDADGTVEPGQTVNYAINASNEPGTRVSTAHNLELVDHVPAGLTPQLPIPGGGSWDPGARTITWTIPSLAPSASTLRNYSATVDDPATAGSVFENTVDLTATSMAGAVAGERGPTSPVTAGYVADAQNIVRLGDATLTKSVDPGSGTIGDQVTYTTEVTFPANVTYFDATVIDTLPAGLVFDDTVSVTCGGGPCTPSVTPLAAEPQPDGTTRVAWFLDDLTAQPATRTYEITYRAHLANSVSNGQTLTNVAGAFYNGTDTISGTPGSIPDPSSFSNGSGPDDADVNVVEPQVALDKTVSGDPDGDDQRPTQPGDSYTYSVKVTNTGTSPAYDVEVTDTPDAALLRNIAVTPNPDANVTDGDGSDGSLGWTIPGPIPVGGSVTLQYTADLAPSAQLHDGDDVVNTADVPRFWGVPKAERDANPSWTFREYTNVPDDTVTLDVHLPKLDVVKTTGAPGFPNSAIAQVGEPFSWRVVISNTATDAVAEDVDVEDVLPANWTYVAGSASFAPGGAAEPTINGQQLSWADVGDIAPGGQIVLTFQARPTVAAIDDPGTGPSSPNVNDAQASAVDASGADGSADGPYEGDDDAQAILELPELSVTKTPDGAAVDAGDDATYSVEIANDGDVPARDVVVSDVLGAGQTYTPGSATASPSAGFSETSVTSGPGVGETTIGWSIAEIPANGSVTITLPMSTDSSLPDDTELVNDASVTSREIRTPVSDDGSYETNVDSDVGIVKQPQAGPVDAGDEMDFTLTVTNHGPSDATGVEVEDVLPANLEFVSAESPCAESGGTVTCAIGDLAANGSVELTLRVRVDPDETVGVSNTATVDSTTPDSNQSNNSSTATKPVGVAANVKVEKDGPAAPVLQGTSFDYAITVSNDGASAATDVTLSDPLPSGVDFENVTTDRGTCSAPGGTVNCSFGTLQPDDVVEVTVRVRAVDVGTFTNTAIVATPSTETTTSDNDDDADVEIVPAADLGTTKSAPATADPGSQIDYQLGIRNNGPSPATGVTLSDTLPAGVQFVSADPGCSAAGVTVTCAVGDLAVSESRSFTVRVAIPYALGGQTLTNSVVVRGNEGDLVTDNDTAQASTKVGPAADLSIAKTAGGATAGGTASWTIVVQNHGPSTGDPVTVTDSLPDGTSFRSAAPSQGSCSAAGSDVSCALGALPAGGSAQISVVADVAPGTAHRQLRNRATVSAPQPDPDPSNNGAEAVVEVAEPTPGGPNLTLRKTASTGRPKLGKPFSYRLLVRNTGDREAPRVRVVDTLSDAVRLERLTTSKGRCSSEGAKTSCSLGTLAAGAQATVKLVVVPVKPGALRNTASVSTSGGDVQPGDNGDVAGVRVMAPKARWTISKRASRRAARGGDMIRFAITVRAGKRGIAGARVCDLLPAGLVFARARAATFHDGRACWKLRYLAPGARRTMHIVARAERGFRVRRVRNVAAATARNAGRRSDGARVRIDPAFGGAGGGVTG